MEQERAGDQMLAYYGERAAVYDRVYAYPERQADLAELRTRVAAYFTSRNVLEVAAGTGYWTTCISQSADQVNATDMTPEALSQIHQRNLRCPVSTQVVDAYQLHTLGQAYDAAFAGLWFSHVLKQDQARWLQGLHSVLHPGARVMMIDNSEAQNQRFPIVETDSEGNTFQLRTTDAGTEYRVLKNFPTPARLRELLGAQVVDLTFEQLTHYWLLSYTLRTA